MAFGKRPLSDQEVRAIRAQAERRRQAWSPATRVPALQPCIDEELAELRRRFGEDDRHLPHATTLAIMAVLEAGSTAGGEAVIEALAVCEKLDVSQVFPEPSYAQWAQTVTAPPPKKNSKKRGGTPFDYAVLSAVEMYWAFELTNGYSVEGGRDPFNDPRTGFLLGACASKLRRMIKEGARFEREPDAILLDWLTRPRRLSPAYKPGGDVRAPRAFLATAFRFELDDERRMVGAHPVRPAWVRSMRKCKWLGKDEPLTEAVVDRLLDRARASMTHAPPAGFINSAMLHERLVERQEDGRLTEALMKHSSAGTRPDGEVLEQLQLSERSDEIREWLLETSSARGLRPVGVVDTRVALSPRSVDSLVAAYETLRREPFKRSGRSRLIPVSEVERLVDFANTRTARRPQ